MKPLLISCLIIITIFIPSYTKAASYPLSAIKTTTGIAVTVSGIPTTDQHLYELYSNDTAVSQTTLNPNAWTQKQTNGTIVWNLTGSNALTNTTYFFYVKKIPLQGDLPFQKEIVTEKASITLGTPWGSSGTIETAFTIDRVDDRTVKVSGTIDTAKYPRIDTLQIKFYYSQTGTPQEGPTDVIPKIVGANGESTIATNGTYSFSIVNLSPNTLYYFKKEISTIGSTSPLEKKLGTFTTQKGYVTPGTVGEELDLNSRSYHLLAPWPGLAMLMDPDLCYQKKYIEKTISENTICDVNGFLDFAFKTMIGLAAVVLVLRLMYEGYVILTSDIPFIQAKAKGDFKGALLGLLLALSAYLILNTINPKLVNNSITIDTVKVGVEDQLAISFSKYTAETGGPLSPDDIKKMRAQYGKAWDAVKTTYIPARDLALPSASKGAKILMTAQTTIEGFYPNTKSWRTNNPGNIGNTDNGSISNFPSLSDGIKEQYNHLTKIVSGKNPAYKIGKKIEERSITDVATGITYPGISFTFDGSLYQYLQIYATGARKDNNYLSFVIAFFEKEGITINGYTKIADIYKMQ